MKTQTRIHLVYWLLASLIAAGIGWGAPTVLNNMIRPHAQDESTFPVNSFGAPGILYGTDAGLLYISPGDGGPWVTVGGSSSGLGCGTGAAGPCVVGENGFITDGGLQVLPTSQPNEAFYIGAANGHDGTALRWENGASDWFFQKAGAGTNQALVLQSGGSPIFLFESTGLLTVNGPGGTGGRVAASNTISSSIPSGNDAFQVNVNGARVHFGTGASDYASSNGTTVAFAGPISAAGSAGSNAISLTVNGSRLDFGTGANDFCSSDGTTITCGVPLVSTSEQVLAATFTDGLPWTATNVDGVISSQQAFTVKRFVWIGQEGSQAGVGANIQWGIDQSYNGTGDGGVCSGSFQCDAVCPDAGIICSIPMTGQCDFAAGEVVLARFIGGNNCTVNPASAAPHMVWGTLR